jgi:tetratricopeptide (TPR) repeat protein
MKKSHRNGRTLSCAVIAAVLSCCTVEGSGRDTPATAHRGGGGYLPGEQEITRYLEAEQLYRETEHGEAAERLEELCESFPAFHQAGLLLAKCRFFLGAYPDAHSELKRLLNIHPVYPQAELWLARTLLQMGRPEEARRRAVGLLEFDPDDLRLLYLTGRIAEQQNDLPTALDCYRRAAAAVETAARPFLALGRIYYHCGAQEKAQEYLERAAAVLSAESALAEPLDRLRSAISKSQQTKSQSGVPND